MPGSWEIARLRENRLLLAIPLPPSDLVNFPFVESLGGIQLPPGSEFMRLSGSPPGHGHNQAALTALQNGYHLGLLDWNMRCTPTAFLQLLARGLDLVSGLYYLPHWPHEPAAFNERKGADGSLGVEAIFGWKPGDLFPAGLVGAGLVIYRRRLLEALFARWPRPFEHGLDVAPVLSSDGSMVPPLGESLVASYRARQLGFQPYVDTQVVGLASVKVRIGPKWLVQGPKLDNPLLGVVAAG